MQPEDELVGKNPTELSLKDVMQQLAKPKTLLPDPQLLKKSQDSLSLQPLKTVSTLKPNGYSQFDIDLKLEELDRLMLEREKTLKRTSNDRMEAEAIHKELLHQIEIMKLKLTLIDKSDDSRRPSDDEQAAIDSKLAELNAREAESRDDLMNIRLEYQSLRIDTDRDIEEQQSQSIARDRQIHSDRRKNDKEDDEAEEFRDAGFGLEDRTALFNHKLATLLAAAVDREACITEEQTKLLEALQNSKDLEAQLQLMRTREHCLSSSKQATAKVDPADPSATTDQLLATIKTSEDLLQENLLLKQSLEDLKRRLEETPSEGNSFDNGANPRSLTINSPDPRQKPLNLFKNAKENIGFVPQPLDGQPVERTTSSQPGTEADRRTVAALHQKLNDMWGENNRRVEQLENELRGNPLSTPEYKSRAEDLQSDLESARKTFKQQQDQLKSGSIG